MANNGPRFQPRDIHDTDMIKKGFFASVVDNLQDNEPILVCADINTAKLVAHALNHQTTIDEDF